MKRLRLLMVVIAMLPWLPAAADVFRLDDLPPLSVAAPDRGLTKSQVEARFGTPERKVSAVGEPPISSWVYPKYTVYFEYDLVLHTVAHRQ